MFKLFQKHLKIEKIADIATIYIKPTNDYNAIAFRKLYMASIIRINTKSFNYEILIERRLICC